MPPSGTYTYYPGTLEVPERSAANTHGVSYKILAQVEIGEGAEGVILAHGSRFGGHALYVQDRKLQYVYNFLGLDPEQHLESGELAPGKYVLGVEFEKERRGDQGESHGTMTLHVGEEKVASAQMRTQSGHFSLCGEGLCIGYDGGDTVTTRYPNRFPFTGGEIAQVEVHVGEDAYVDLERHLQAALARD